MTKNGKKLCVWFLVLCAAVVLVYCLCMKVVGAILEGKVFGGLMPLVQLVWTPDGYFDPLDEVELVIVQGQEVTLSTVHKYIGKHVMRLALGGRGYECPDDWLDIQLKLEASAGVNLLLEKVVDVRECGGCYYRDEETGVLGLWYMVPAEIPIREDITWHVSVLQAGRADGIIATVRIEKIDDY